METSIDCVGVRTYQCLDLEVREMNTRGDLGISVHGYDEMKGTFERARYHLRQSGLDNGAATIGTNCFFGAGRNLGLAKTS